MAIDLRMIRVGLFATGPPRVLIHWLQTLHLTAVVSESFGNPVWEWIFKQRYPGNSRAGPASKANITTVGCRLGRVWASLRPTWGSEGTSYSFFLHSFRVWFRYGRLKNLECITQHPQCAHIELVATYKSYRIEVGKNNRVDIRAIILQASTPAPSEWSLPSYQR